MPKSQKTGKLINWEISHKDSKPQSFDQRLTEAPVVKTSWRAMLSATLLPCSNPASMEGI
jgi:hypothetical protein